MHPIMKSMRSSLAKGDAEEVVDCGIAQKGDEAFAGRAQMSRDKRSSHVEPPKAKDLFRDAEPKMAEERDLKYHAGNAIQLDRNKCLTPTDFSPDFPGSNAAMRHVEAAEMQRDALHTRSLEKWAHDSFMAHARVLLCKHSTRLGMLYISDFLQMYVSSPPRHELAMQMVAIQQHVDSPPLRRILKDITKQSSSGSLSNKWFLDLVEVLQMVLEEESSISTQLSAIGVVCNRMSLHFAKRACGGHYPTADKLAKTSVYFRRIIMALLVLADKLGCYERNSVSRRPKRKVDKDIEVGDETYMFSLKSALEEPESDEDDDDDEESSEEEVSDIVAD